MQRVNNGVKQQEKPDGRPVLDFAGAAVRDQKPVEQNARDTVRDGIFSDLSERAVPKPAGHLLYCRYAGVISCVEDVIAKAPAFVLSHGPERTDRMQNRMYQVSTLQALALGYSRAVISVDELLREGDTGLGTFEDVNGEMIVMDGHCYRADQNGCVTAVAPRTGVPFAAVARLSGEQRFPMRDMPDIDSVRTELTRKIEERFGLNSMHVVRIDGEFAKVDARSEAPYRSHHISLKEILGQTQKAFIFENIRGSLVGVYFPDYMDGINMPGWHLHFLSDDRSKGGHVFDVSLREGAAKVDKISSIVIDLPREAAFDTYSLKQDLQEEIKSVE